MATYDLVVVGAGPGGYVAALRAAQLGLRTAVVEADRLGGVCGNWGCIPSKALLHDAEVVADVRTARKSGLLVGEVTADFGKAVDRSRGVADQQGKGVAFLFKKHGVDYRQGRGRLVRGGVAVSANGGAPERVDARHVLVATGSGERLLPGMQVDGRVVQTSREALADRTLPASLVVIGGGAVGVELAYVYAAFGAKVTVVEMAPTLLPGMDEDLGRELARAFAKQGIDVRTGHRYERLALADGGATVTVAGPSGPVTLRTERVLVAVGRTPLTADLGLEDLGVRMDRGFVPVDRAMRTTAPGVSAIGDIVGPLLLAHAASEQGVLAVEAMAGHEGAPAFDPLRVPLCVYCQPEVAAIGLTEAQARADGRAVKVGKFPFRALGKAMATGHVDGFVKVVADAQYGQLLGVHMLGHGVTELIAEAALALTLETTLAEVIATVHAHPTLAEALREAALAADDRAINV